MTENSRKLRLGRFGLALCVAGAGLGLAASHGHAQPKAVPAITINDAGNVGIQKTDPAQALDVSGNVAASGTITGSTMTSSKETTSSGPIVSGSRAGLYPKASDGTALGIMTLRGPNTVNVIASAIVGNAERGGIVVVDEKNEGRAGIQINAANRGLVWGDVKSFRMDYPGQPGKVITYASIEGPEAGAYLRGSAQLVSGAAAVAFPDHFTAVAATEGMTVQLTPTDPESFGLAAVRLDNTGLEVRELRGGTSDQTFYYTVMAKRAALADYQPVRDSAEFAVQTAE